MNDIKNCYICLPIAGRESDAIERATNAANYVNKTFGLNPITPMDINNESQEILDNPNRPVGWFMGRDIETIIEKCDAIFVCKGWENSAGCNVEIECAKQYNKVIIYEQIPINMTISEWFMYRKDIAMLSCNIDENNIDKYNKETDEILNILNLEIDLWKFLHIEKD